MPKLINKVRDLNMSQVESGPPSIHLEPTEPQQVTPSYAVKNAKTTNKPKSLELVTLVHLLVTVYVHGFFGFCPDSRGV